MSEILTKIRKFIEEQDKIFRETKLKNKPILEKYNKEVEEFKKKNEEYSQKYSSEDKYKLISPDDYPELPRELKRFTVNSVVSNQLKEMFKEELKNE